MLAELDGVEALRRVRHPAALAERAFGSPPVAATVARVRGILVGWGYDGKPESTVLFRNALCRALVVARSARLEDVTRAHIDALLEMPDRCDLHRSLALLARVLRSLGIIDAALDRIRDRGYRPLGEDGNGVPPTRLAWCRRWREHSTLRSADSRYWCLLKAGRWLAEKHPEVEGPEGWTAELAAEYVAAVDGMRTGDYNGGGWTRANPGLAGKPLRPSSKANELGAMRGFFQDCQEWGWIPVRFNPLRCLRTPRSVRAQLGPDPRVIDPAIWARLVRAGLELEAADFGPRHQYPIEMDRALAAIWVTTGLRSDEVARLRVGCVRWQGRDAAVPGTGDVLPKDAVCLLDVPVNKTSAAFTKPVPPVVGSRIGEWERARPPEQNPQLDPKTGETVRFLFSVRNNRVPNSYVNEVFIPALRRRAGVPERDARGRITSHRARATIASQLYNAPDPWTLPELQAFLGHTDPKSTQYYAKVDPTKLAKRYADTGYLEANQALVEVLLDADALAAGRGAEALYYELGHGLCKNPNWSRCPYRMACVRCEFYVPGERAQYIRARQGIRRMLETIPLTDEEKRVAEGDEEALGELLGRNAGMPAPSGRAPRGPGVIPPRNRIT